MTIRNFAIIAHVDHGKSTLADRLLEVTGTISKEKMKPQLLDQLSLERERGITIKLAPVRMEYQGNMLNLIDTPGHVDFSYEVSRSLAAVEGALLLVDASQGIQAQTLSVASQAKEQGLVLIPVINKIDLSGIELSVVANSIKNTFGFTDSDIIYASGKTGQGITEILEAIIKKIPQPKFEDHETKALIFDSFFDPYRGVIAYIRVFSGEFKANDETIFLGSSARSKLLEVGVFKPQLVPIEKLSAGEIGYLVTGLKNIREVRVGDTVTTFEIRNSKIEIKPLSGYKQVQSLVFASLFLTDEQEARVLREAIERLQLNDSSLSFEPERSIAFGFGFRCGFLGLLHMEIVKERLEREFGLDLIVTVPSVSYEVLLSNNTKITIKNPSELPNLSKINEILEPWVSLEIITPKEYIGSVMELVANYRGNYIDTKFIDEKRAMLIYEAPLSSILVDFYDQLKSKTAGFASLSYEFLEYRAGDLERLDIIVSEKIVDTLSTIIHKDEAYSKGRAVVDKLKELIPRQLFEVKIQAAIGSKIIASNSVSALRKDVTAKLYGGDVTRKKKLLEKQKKGKKKMKTIGNVEIPSDVFLNLLKK